MGHNAIQKHGREGVGQLGLDRPVRIGGIGVPERIQVQQQSELAVLIMSAKDGVEFALVLFCFVLYFLITT